MRKAEQYIAEAKKVLGNPAMSDRELGQKLGGKSQQFIWGAKAGKMTDPLAIELADLIGVERGEVLMVARLERERDPAVKAALLDWAGKIFGLLPSVGTLNAVQAGVLVAGQMQKASMVSHGGASIGGDGGIRTLDTLLAYAPLAGEYLRPLGHVSSSSKDSSPEI